MFGIMISRYIIYILYISDWFEFNISMQNISEIYSHSNLTNDNSDISDSNISETKFFFVWVRWWTN